MFVVSVVIVIVVIVIVVVVIIVVIVIVVIVIVVIAVTSYSLHSFVSLSLDVTFQWRWSPRLANFVRRSAAVAMVSFGFDFVLRR